MILKKSKMPTELYVNFLLNIFLLPNLKDHVLVEFRFTEEYPLKPPSLRIIWPRFINATVGRYITLGGAVQLDLFRTEEWSPSKLELSLLTIRISKADFSYK